ncbi:protein SOSEKI 3-like [Wolffia australiana]
MRKFGNASPERAKVWTEPPPKHHHHQNHQPRGQSNGRKVPVVYYLCRNRHLEHPHFIEVPTSSPDGLFLRDVINRLNALRGKRVTASYSWSCKRSYKNGFVWHDLSEDDLVLPTNGDEYVLKGSEILDSSPNSGRSRAQSSNPKQTLPPPPPPEIPSASRSQDSSPSAAKEEIPSPSSNEYRVHKAMGAADAATQTEEAEGGASKRTKRAPGRTISSEELTADLQKNRPPRSSRSCELIRDEITSPLAATGNFSPGGKIDTLESLIRADAARNLNSFRILEEEIPVAGGSAKMKPISVLMQLITCGSISVKGHHSLGLVPRYRPTFSHSEFPSPPTFSGSMMLGEIHGLSKSPRLAETRPEEQSNGGDWSPQSPLPPEGKAQSKRHPKSVRVVGGNNSKKDGAAPPRSPPLSSPSPADCQLTSCGVPVASPSMASSLRTDSFHREDRVIKIEERLTSGARVIIQSAAPCQDSEGSSDGL